MSKDYAGYDELTPPIEGRKPRGCVFYGCIFGLILAGLAVLLVGVVSFFILRFASKTITTYTDTVPMPLPASTLTVEEAESVQQRVQAFKAAAEEGREATLTLTGPELNALVNNNPETRGKVALDIVGDELIGHVSIPWEVPGMGLRYLNGKANLYASIDDGEIEVYMRSLEIKGKPMPENMMKDLRQRDLADDFHTDPETEKLLRRIEDLTVRDGKLVVRSRAKRPADEPPPDAEPAERQPQSDPNAPEPAPLPPPEDAPAPPPEPPPAPPAP